MSRNTSTEKRRTVMNTQREYIMINFTTRLSTIFLIGFAMLAFATPTVHGQGRGMRMRPMMPPRQVPMNHPGMMRTQPFFSPRQFDRFEDRFERRFPFGRFDRFEDRLERRFSFDPFLRSRFISDPFLRREFFSNPFLRRDLFRDPFLGRELFSNSFLRRELLSDPFLRRELLSDPFFRIRFGFDPFLGVGPLVF
jgi:hypothetical protein